MSEFVVDDDNLGRDRHVTLDGDLSDHMNSYCEFVLHTPVFLPTSPHTICMYPRDP